MIWFRVSEEIGIAFCPTTQKEGLATGSPAHPFSSESEGKRIRMRSRKRVRSSYWLKSLMYFPIRF